jgi:type I restriction enzyme S subunit
MTTQQTLQTEEYKQTELGELPKSWEVVKVKDVSEKLKAGGTPSRGKKEYWNGDIPFVLIEDMTATRLYLIQTKEKITKKGLENSSAWIVPENSILLSMYATIGSTAINKIKLATNQAILAIIPKNNFDVLYGAYILRFNAERLKSYNIATTQKNVNKGIVENFEIPLPPLPEQQRIAYVLSTVQNAQEKTENFINSLKELKKSAMKHLFTYGAVSFEDIDKVELKETEIGMMPKSWGVVELGKLVEIKGGKRLPKGHNFSDKPTNFPYIRIVDFKNNSIKLDDLRYLTQEDKEKIRKYIITKDDIYISIAGTIGLIGTIPETLDGANLTENACRLIIQDKKILDKNYLVFFLSSNVGQKEIQVRYTKTSQPKLALMRIKQIPAMLPPLPIQQNIASILSAIDSKIQAEEQKKEALKETFNSLLRDLMTAKIRVNNLKISNNTNTKR